MIEARLFMRAGVAASIVGHMAVLYVGLMFANARPFEYSPTESIAIDIVTPEEAKELPKPTEPPKPDQQKQPDQKQPEPIDFSALTAPTVPIQTFEPLGKKQASQKAARPASPPTAPPQASNTQQTSTAQQASAAQQATVSQQASVAQQASVSQQASIAPQATQPQGTEALQPTTQAPLQPAVPPPPPPDVTVKYGVLLGLPAADGYRGFDAPAIDLATIDSNNIMEFRRHLKSCSSLPTSVAPTDKVRIVLRVVLTQTGKLAGEPVLIEASASAKGPLLMQKALQALEACQPYTMLPADKYKEWKVLDLAFTPHDFGGG